VSRPRREHGRLRELITLFGTLGIIGFGGPAAHVALMRREVVERRGWLTDTEMVDLVGVTSLIPGPNSTELAMLVGLRRAGRVGLLVAGVAFILPAAAIVLALAWAYIAYGTTPAGEAVLYGIAPVIVAVVVAAVIAFARTALIGPPEIAVAVAVAILWLVGVSEIVLLVAGALVIAAARLGLPARAAVFLAPATAAGIAAVDLPTLAAVFLKAGALLYGSGYVLVAFLRGDLVERLGWLTDTQLIDAVAVGQVTPGPLFTTATFIGFVLAGIPGAVVATVAIFLPAFVVVALLGPWIGRIRDRPLTSALLDGVNAAAIGLMAAVSFELARSAFVDPLTIAIGAVAAVAMIVARAPSVLLILVGAVAGIASTLPFDWMR
jgi:chromate transporter